MPYCISSLSFPHNLWQTIYLKLKANSSSVFFYVNSNPIRDNTQVMLQVSKDKLAKFIMIHVIMMSPT